MKRCSILILLLSISLNLCGQISKSKELILGRWDLVEIVKDTTVGIKSLLDISTEDSESLDKEDKSAKEVIFYFTAKGEFQELRFGRKTRTDYRFISNDILIIGETTFKISKITTDRLKIERYEEMDLSPPEILIFQKSDKPFKFIKK